MTEGLTGRKRLRIDRYIAILRLLYSQLVSLTLVPLLGDVQVWRG